jgi:hypothetical protein
MSCDVHSKAGEGEVAKLPVVVDEDTEERKDDIEKTVDITEVSRSRRV